MNRLPLIISIALAAACHVRLHAAELAVSFPTESALPKLGPAPTGQGEPSQDARVAGRLARAQAATSSSGSLQLEGFSINTTDRLANLIDYHQHYTSEGDDTSLIGWTGSVESCDPGTISSSYHDLVRRRINYFRGQAGLSTTITFDPAKDAACQQAALVMVRQKDLSHTPLTDWPSNPCVTAATQVTASASNLALGSFGLNSIDRLMIDDGSSNGPVGHRRWFLYPQATEMGHGSIPYVANYSSACIVWVIGDFGSVPPAKPVMWPNEGYCPYTIVPNDSATYPRWSFSYPHADFSQATVSVELDGNTLSASREALAGNIGDATLVWRIYGIPATAPPPGTNSTAKVTITGIRNSPFTSYTYNVVIYDPYNLHQEPTITGPQTPAVAGGSLYTFQPVDAAESYRLRVANQVPSTWTEGGETLDTILDGTSTAYSLQSTALASSGNRSFQMVFPDVNEQRFEIDRIIVPGVESSLEFKRRFRFFSTESRLRAQISDNEGVSWTTLYEAAGRSTGRATSETWDANWVPISIAIPDTYANRPVRLRFSIAIGGSYYPWTSGNTLAHYGVFIDEIGVTEASQILNEQLTTIPAEATSFILNSTTAGSPLSQTSDYILQLAAVVGGRQFDFTAPLSVRPANVPADERTLWLQANFGQDEETGDAAAESDFDNDGLSNLIERALGLDPTKPEEAETITEKLPSGDLPDAGTLAGRPTLQFSIPAAPHSDITYEVQQSPNLSNWTTLARKVGSAPWQSINSGVTITQGTAAADRVPTSVAAPSMVTTTGSVHLRLSVSSAE